MSDGWNNQFGIAKRFQGDEADTSREVLLQFCGSLKRQPCLSDTSGACEDQQPYVCTPEQVTGVCYFLLTANQWCERSWKRICVDRFRVNLGGDDRSQ